MAETELKVKVSSYLGVKKIVRIFDLSTGNVLAIGGQKEHTLNRTADTIDVSTKTGGIQNMQEIMAKMGVTDWKPKEYNDYKEYIQGQKEWSVDVSGALPASDAAYDILEAAYENGTPVGVSELDLGRMKEKVGIAIPTELSEEAPIDDLAGYSLSLTGTGPQVSRTYVPTPPSGS
ncbi:phage tail tube protein [Bacillus cereus]|uniref:phage tail tube protein n=1 Tax=Bacillus cereus TaxID=1396 RepID=UPI000BF5B6B3|nr:phage tail tube protein [Bacillus cereus]PFC37596.1 phage tail protein [Bacillus cereus]